LRNAADARAVARLVTTGQWILLVSVLGALAFGTYRAWADGRFTGTHRVRGAVSEAAVGEVHFLAEHDVAHSLGERATLVQFSSAFCAPCRATRRVLTEVAEIVPGVEHVEVDAEHHLELVRALGIVRTPTTLVLDHRGREVTRAMGALRKEKVMTALAELT
jgi:thiol-disulfide isomerase/thioredoxin